jgi:maltooligosyltrehalose trehalohydrolase
MSTATTRTRLVGAWIESNGARWTVWAPDHRAVDLVLDPGTHAEHSIAMTRTSDGYFTCFVDGAKPGTRYKYRVDGEGPYPDPASRSQPDGPHGASELVDLAFAWTDQSWHGVALAEVVIYEVHVGTATSGGTFDALVERLPEIRSVGVTAIELMPVATFPGRRNWGYDGVSLYAPAAVYGGPRGLQRLVDAAHAVGLAVIVDVVFNHLGPDGNYLRAYTPRYFTDRHKTPWGDAMRLDDPDAGPVRDWMIANAEMWIRDYHVDGLRLDATHALIDDSEPHILTELAAHARAAARDRRVLLFAEDERNEAKLVMPRARGGYELDGVWADDFHHQVRRAFAGDAEGYFADFTGRTDDLARTLRDGWFYRGQHSAHLGHARGTDSTHVDVTRFVHCIQNHDQIGNRAFGDRLGASIDASAYRVASALLLLSPGTPLLFMGQDWNASAPFLYFTDHNPELGRLVSEGRRREFERFSAFAHAEIPDPQADETFTRSVLDWEERLAGAHRAMLEWYRALLALRATHPAIRNRTRDRFDARAVGDNALVLEYRRDDARLQLIANLRGTTSMPLPRSARFLVDSEEHRFGGSVRPLVTTRDEGIVLSGPRAIVFEY